MVSEERKFFTKTDKGSIDAEPWVRIGFILAEDGKREVFLQPEKQKYQLEAGGENSELDKDQVGPLKIRADEGTLTLSDTAGNQIASHEPVVALEPVERIRAEKPGDGLLVKDVVSGRGFHWHKEIDQTLSGRVEFHARGDLVIGVNVLPLEEYLTGVITGEMSGECPIEFMKAQATCARTWLLASGEPKHSGEPFDWCNDDDCQRYQGTGGWSERAIEAIGQCRGVVVLTSDGSFCDARYSKSCGGIAEDAESVWGEPIPGLKAVVDAPAGSEVEKFFPVREDNVREYLGGEWAPQSDAFCCPTVVPESELTRYLGRVDEGGEYFRWRRTFSATELKESLQKRGEIQDLEEVLDLVVRRRGKSGRIEALEVIYRDTRGQKKEYLIEREYWIRAAMSMDFLYSSAFIPDVEKNDRGEITQVHLNGGGWGHGAGFCQIGALGMAIKGYASEAILKHYFSDVKIQQIYD